MNKYLKYATRTIIIVSPAFLSTISYVHLGTCKERKDCIFCWLSCFWFVSLLMVLVVLGIAWIILNWEEIWE